MDTMERLAYQNRFVRQLVQDLEGYEASDAVPQVISGPENLILLQVSYDEWIKLTSSVFTGADICYPSESDTVRWILYRAVEQPMDLCALIAECIATSEGTQEALRNFILNDPAIQEYITQNISKGAPLLPEIETLPIVQNDDLDELFGAVTFLVDTINSAIEDFNQDAEAANNSRELGAIIFGAFPIIETLPFDEVSEYIDTLFEQIIEVYNSQWDTTPVTGTRDRIRCDLFCIARDNDNSLTWSLIQDYFYSRTGFTWSTTINIMLEFANFLATGTWSGEEVVDIAFGNFAAAMSGMGKFGDMLFPSLSALMRLGQNDPDPDWETLCEDCSEPPPAQTFNLVSTYPGVVDVVCTYLGKDGIADIWQLVGPPAGLPVNDAAMLPMFLVDAATDVPTSYQHREVGGEFISGSGFGASPPSWDLLGFFGVTTTVIKIRTP